MVRNDETDEPAVHVADVFHFGNDFLPDVTAFVIADSALAEFRQSCCFVDVDTVNRKTGFCPQHIPGTMIHGGGSSLRYGMKDCIGLGARNPDVVAEIRNQDPAVVHLTMRISG